MVSLRAQQGGREGIASRYISEGGKARYDASLCTELCGEGRRYTGSGYLKPGRLGPTPFLSSALLRHLCGVFTIAVMLLLSWGDNPQPQHGRNC